MIVGRFSERLANRGPRFTRPTVTPRARRVYRTLAVLCFTAVFVTATEPVIPFTPDNLVAALEKISNSQGFAAAAWR